MQVKKGFTIIEVLVIIAIISLLLIAAIGGYFAQLPKARDAQRKSDLEKLKIAFEDYYNDNECYPPPEILSNCSSSDLAPHLAGGIPCDPKLNTPYCYVYDAESPCQTYRILASLESQGDPSIVASNFDSYCQGDVSYNYIIASGNLDDPLDSTGIILPTPTPSTTPGSSPTPTPTPSSSAGPTPVPSSSSGPGPYACQGNICNNFGYPNSCPISFASASECVNFCPTADPSYSCN